MINVQWWSVEKQERNSVDEFFIVFFCLQVTDMNSDDQHSEIYAEI